jgi:hypothetical protein
MTLADDQQPEQNNQSSDNGPDREGRSGRRRRRGRRPGDGAREGVPQERAESAPSGAHPDRPTAPSGPENRPESRPERRPERRNDRPDTRPERPSDAPASDSADTQPGEGGERSGRNRRRSRNRNRGGEQPRDGQAPQGASAAPGQGPQQERTRPARPAQPQRGDQPKPEKKERPSRGSVLNRRQTRGEYGETGKQKEEAPQYVPVSAATVEQYVNGHKNWQKEVLATLRSIVQSVAPDIEESIMWSQPVFSANGPVCFFKAYKDSVTFGFWRGTELSDPEGLLSGDLTMMRIMTLKSAKDIKRDAFEELVKQAVRLNREKGDPTLS